MEKEIFIKIIEAEFNKEKNCFVVESIYENEPRLVCENELHDVITDIQVQSIVKEGLINVSDRVVFDEDCLIVLRKAS